MTLCAKPDAQILTSATKDATPPLTSELRRLEGLSTELSATIDQLEDRLTQVLPIATPTTGVSVPAKDSYGVPYADFASDSNDRLERQIARINVLLRDIAI